MYRIPNLGQRYAPFVKGYCFDSFSQDRTELLYRAEEEFTQMYSTMPGQITRDSPFGKELYNIAKTDSSLRWLEIGTWNGLGTTKCILDGFAERLTEKPLLTSLEIDPVLFHAAAENLKDHPARSCVTFYQGKLMPYSMTPGGVFPRPEDIDASDQNSPHFYIHYDRERALYESATPFLPPFYPEVAVLDGGEYSGYLDWLHLELCTLKYLCLDDANVTKNRKVVAELGPQWSCIARGDDRNGWAIYKRV